MGTILLIKVTTKFVSMDPPPFRQPEKIFERMALSTTFVAGTAASALTPVPETPENVLLTVGTALSIVPLVDNKKDMDKMLITRCPDPSILSQPTAPDTTILDIHKLIPRRPRTRRTSYKAPNDVGLL